MFQSASIRVVQGESNVAASHSWPYASGMNCGIDMDSQVQDMRFFVPFDDAPLPFVL